MSKRTRSYSLIVHHGAPSDRPLTLERMARDVQGEHLYYIRVQNLVKIGYTSALLNRMYNYGPAWQQRLLHLEPGTRDDEQALHKRFRPFLAYGREFYAPVPHLLRHINERRASMYGLDAIDWRTVEHRRAV